MVQNSKKWLMFNKASVLVSGGENENYHEAAV
jgi:hypothetical protein